MSKEYIRDNGKIRNCTSNIAKMNVLEYIWFDIYTKKFFKYAFLTIFENGKETLENLMYLILNLIAVVLFPLTLTYKANNEVKIAKKSMKKVK